MFDVRFLLICFLFFFFLEQLILNQNLLFLKHLHCLESLTLCCFVF